MLLCLRVACIECCQTASFPTLRVARADDSHRSQASTSRSLTATISLAPADFYAPYKKSSSSRSVRFALAFDSDEEEEDPLQLKSPSADDSGFFDSVPSLSLPKSKKKNKEVKSLEPQPQLIPAIAPIEEEEEGDRRRSGRARKCSTCLKTDCRSLGNP